MMDTYMAAFHVFVVGAVDASPTGLSKLADAIAGNYGLPAAALLARLQAGRFRVKGNIDRATAETYARDLTRLGAHCAIEDATADEFGGATPIPFPAVKPLSDAAAPTRPTPQPQAARATTPSAPPSALPPRAATTPSTPPSALPPRDVAPTRPTPPPSALPARAASTPSAPPSALPPRADGPSIPPANSGQFQSGLSAAFSGDLPAADLGALGREDAFSLSSVDGADDGSPGATSSPASDGGGFAASIGPSPDAAPAKAAKPKAGAPTDEPLDMFAPPEMQGDEFKVDIASDERDVARASAPAMDDAAAAPSRPSSQRIPTTPASQRIPTTPASGRISKPSLQAPVDVVAPSSNKFGPLGEPRIRFAAGLLLSIILGFVPAHFIAKMREDSAYETIDRKVIAAQQAADTLDTWQGLERMRVDQLARKESEKRNAAIIGFVLWALAGSGIAWVFFKKIPWDA